MEPDVTPLFGVPFNPNAPSPGTATASPQPQTQPQPVHNGKHSGVAGVARDILGTLGDFILVHAGLKPMYGPAQHQRELAEATANFQSDPLGAINRVRPIDSKLAQDMYDNYQTQTRLNQNDDFNQTYKLDLKAQRDQDYKDKTLRTANGMLNFNSTDVGPDGAPKSWSIVRSNYNKYIKARGLGDEDLLPETYDPALITTLRNSSITPAQQEQADATKDYRDVVLANQREGLGLRARTVAEEARSHHANENIDQQRVNKPTAVQTYTGQDGYRYTKMSDGNVVKSDQPVQKPGASRRAPPSLPQEGEERVVGGVPYVWRNGKAVRK